MEYDPIQVAAMIDHTNLRPDATTADFERLCGEARTYGFKSVAINPAPVKLCRGLLAGSSVLVGAAIAFPLGQLSVNAKALEAACAIEDGCQEFDFVLNVGKLKERDFIYIEREMRELVNIAREAEICCKVIFETCYLTDDEIIAAAKIAAQVRPDFIKTSTGFGTAGATPAHVALMKRCASENVQVKAAGGIRTWTDARAMLEAGATRLGTSAGVKIIEELKAQHT